LFHYILIKLSKGLVRPFTSLLVIVKVEEPIDSIPTVFLELVLRGPLEGGAELKSSVGLEVLLDRLELLGIA